MYKRGNRKVLADYKSNDLYKFYKKKYSSDKVVDYSTYARILNEFYPEIVKLIIYEGMEFILPARLGTLRIRRKKIEPTIDKDGNLDIRRLSPNWKKTMELWRKQYPGKTAEEIKSIPNKHVIKELNEHSDNYRYLWYWDRVICNVPNQSAYKLDMTRTNDRLLANAIKTIPNLEYYD